MTKKEKEALRRLEILKSKGMLNDVVKEYKENYKICFSDYCSVLTVAFPILCYIDYMPEQVRNKIEELTKDGDVVYHATHEKFEFGECWDLFVITDEDVANDEFGEGMRKDFDNYGIQFAYVMNVSVPEFSEFGSIQVQPRAGGIERIS